MIPRPESTKALRARRGWVYSADLEPGRGTEPGKVRPVLALQTDLLNRCHPSTIVLPLTTKVRPDLSLLRVHLRKGQAGLTVDSDIIVDQIRSIDNRRLRRELGAVPAGLLTQVERRVAALLDLTGA